MIRFEWDPRKAQQNVRKHGVTFEEATTVFGDPLSLSIPDHDHSEDESRCLILGRSSGQRLMVVSFTERGEGIRLIGARQATAHERKVYEKSPKET